MSLTGCRLQYTCFLSWDISTFGWAVLESREGELRSANKNLHSVATQLQRAGGLIFDCKILDLSLT